MTITLNPNVPAVIDVTTLEPALFHPDASHTMTQGQRQLIASFVEAQFNGDLQAAINHVTRKLTPAQEPYWCLHLKQAASDWASTQSAPMDITEDQLDASLYFVALLQGTKQHDNPQVVATLRGLNPQIRNMLVQQFLMVTTQGEYNRARKRLTALVPGIVTNRRQGLNPEDEAMFANTGEVVFPDPAPGGEEPF